MNDFCFATFIKILRTAFTDKSTTNEETISLLFTQICYTCEIKNRAGNNYDNVKELSSLLMNRKVDLPKELRLTLKEVPFNKIKKAVKLSIYSLISSDMVKTMLSKMKEVYLKDMNSKKTLNGYSDCLDLITFYLIETAKVNNKIIDKSKILLQRGNTTIYEMYGDILKLGFNSKHTPISKIIVIPVDTSFNMHLSKLGESPFMISPNSLHGKWIMKMNQNGFDENLLVSKINITDKGNIGTIADILYKNNVFWLLACSTFDSNFNSHSLKQSIEVAIDCLLKYYDKHGQGYMLYIPLIGTGLSRAGLSNNESYNLLLEIINKHIDSISGQITIVKYERNESYEFDNV